MPKYGESNTGTPGVIKINYPESRQVGYLVRAKRRSKSIHEIFYIGQFNGDWKRCYAAARDRAMQFFLENQRYDRREIAEIISRRNKSGVVGVRIKETRYRWKSDPKQFTIFLDAEAAWSPERNKVKKRTFSLEKYGEKEAWRLACKTRREGLQEMKRQ
jgi:hypothetical protein